MVDSEECLILCQVRVEVKEYLCADCTLCAVVVMQLHPAHRGPAGEYRRDVAIPHVRLLQGW